MGLRKRALPYMISSSQELNITTQCAILDATEIIYIERVRSQNLVNLELAPGSRLPAYCTSMGKVLLAYLDKDSLEKTLEKMELIPVTPYTITDKKTLMAQIRRNSTKRICNQQSGID